MTNYQHVNSAWPDKCPVPSPQEAIAGARRLVRLALTLGPAGQRQRPFRGRFKITSGNRRTWTRNGVFYVNPDWNGHPNFSGWSAIVHDLSHWAFDRMYDRGRLGPHAPQHAFIERALAEHVVRSGWLDGKLRRERKPKAPVDVRRVRYERTLASIAAWERKAARARTALKKLAARRAYYERRLGA